MTALQLSRQLYRSLYSSTTALPTALQLSQQPYSSLNSSTALSLQLSLLLYSSLLKSSTDLSEALLQLSLLHFFGSTALELSLQPLQYIALQLSLLEQFY